MGSFASSLDIGRMRSAARSPWIQSVDVVRCPSCRKYALSEASPICPNCSRRKRFPRSEAGLRTVTALACDLVGSTELSVRMPPEVFRRLEVRYYATAKQAIEEFGGQVEKFAGDAVFAFFGLSVQHEDDPARALRAAATIVRKVRRLSALARKQWGVEFACRIGVSTGIAAVNTREDPPIAGATLALADRLQKIAGTNAVAMDAETQRRARRVIDVKRMSPIVPKGFDGHVQPFELIRLRARPAGSTHGFVGRTQELRRLRALLLSSARTRRPSIALVAGDPGIGKTSLLDAFAHSLQPSTRVVQVACLPHRQSPGYAPLRSLWSEQSSEEAPWESSVDIDQAVWAIRSAVEHLATEGPCVVLVDDVHLADEVMQDCLERVAATISGARALIVITYRPEEWSRASTWQLMPEAQVIVLDPMVKSELAHLLAELLGQRPSPALVERISDLSAGVPLLVEEIVDLLLEWNGLETVRNLVTLRRDVDGQLGSRIDAIFSARVNSLDEDLFATLRAASVIGDRVELPALSALLPNRIGRHLNRHIAALVAKRFLLLDNDAVRFKHVLVREAAYEGVPLEARSRLHERYAQWLSEEEDSRLGRAAAISFHLAWSSDLANATAPNSPRTRRLRSESGIAAVTAGRRALLLDDSSGALTSFTRAVESLPARSTELVEGLLGLGSVLRGRGELRRALDSFTAAQGHARAMRARRLSLLGQLRVMTVQSQMYSTTNNQELLKSSELIAERLARVGDLAGVAEATHFAALRYYTLGRVKIATRRFKEAAAQARRANDMRQYFESLRWTCIALEDGPTHIDSGLSQLMSIRELGAESPRVLAFADLAESAFAAMQGDFESARALLSRAERALKGLALPVHAAAWGTFHRAYIESLAGNPAMGARAARRGCNALRSMGETAYLSTAAWFAASALIDLGNRRHLDEAREYVSLISRTAALDDAYSQIGLLETTGRLLAATGSIEKGEAHVSRASEMARSTDFLDLRAQIHLEVAEILGSRYLRRATRNATLARDLSARKGNSVRETLARDLLGRLL